MSTWCMLFCSSPLRVKAATRQQPRKLNLMILPEAWVKSPCLRFSYSISYLAPSFLLEKALFLAAFTRDKILPSCM